MTAKGRGAFAPDGSRYITLTDGAGNLVTAEPPSGTAGGDLSGTFPNPTVAKVNGVALTVPSSGILVGTTDSQTLSNKTLTAPALGVATATSINKVALTAPATGSTLTIVDGKTLTVNNTGAISGGDNYTLAIAANKTLTSSNTLTLAGTDGSTLNVATGGTLTSAAFVSTLPTQQIFTSSSGTYTTPAGVKWLRVRMVGGGGGGGAGNNGTPTAATQGGSSSFGGIVAGGGGLGGDLVNSRQPASASSLNGYPGFIVVGPTGGASLPTGTTIAQVGGYGFGTAFGGGAFSIQGANGASGPANTGSGGAGGASTASGAQPGGAGGPGSYVEVIISSPSATYAYAVGSGGTGGSGGTNGYGGGAGGSGIIVVEEHYNY